MNILQNSDAHTETATADGRQLQQVLNIAGVGCATLKRRWYTIKRVVWDTL